MTLLAIDHGAKKIGLAISDEHNKFALPLEILEGESLKKILVRLREIIEQRSVEKIIVGVPLSLRAEDRTTFMREADKQNSHMQTVLNFIDFLKINLSVPIEMADERLSTKLANSLNKGHISAKGKDDAVAAMVILQQYLDRKNL